jgi:hypothetical protein
MRFLKNGELEDKKIVAALRKAADDYENGEIIEVRDLLWDIVDSITTFEGEGE